MPHEMVGFRELKAFNDRKREEENSKYVKAAAEQKKTIMKMTATEVGKRQAYVYAKSLYLSSLSSERR